MATRRLLVPAATAIAVVVIAAGAGVVANRQHATKAARPPAHVGSPVLPPLAVQGAAGDAIAAAVAPQETRKLGAPAGVGGTPTVTIKGTLPPASDALVPAYRLTRRAPTSDDVGRLANALGIKGKPVSQGGSMVLSDGARYVAVDPTPALDWRLQPGDGSCGSGAGMGGAGGVQVAPPAIGSAAPGPPGGAPADTPTRPSSLRPKPNVPAGKEFSATTPPDEPSDPPIAVPPVEPGKSAVAVEPGPCAGVGVSATGVACAAPEGAETLVACPTQEAKPVATEDAAKTTALALLEKLGVKAEAADVHVDAGYDGVRHVSVRRRVEGRPVEGLATEIGVDASSTVVTASGQLAEPVLAGEYPMVPAAELAKTLANTRVRMMMCVRDPKGGDGCAPPPPIVVTGASAGLSLVYPADYDLGEAYLLPAWLFTIEGDPQPTAVVAVPSKYRSEPAPPAVEGDRKTEPNGAPVQIAPVPEGAATSPAHPPVGTGDLLPIGPVALPTGSWKVGDPAMLALISGTLTLEPSGCLGLKGAGEDARPTPLLWPAGYTAEMTADSLVVKSGAGKVVARTGERFSAGGGLAGHPIEESSMSPAVSGCGTAEAFAIQDPGPYNTR